MDLLQVNQDNSQLITERNNCLPPLLSSLANIDNSVKLLDNIKLCIKYLSTYDLTVVQDEFLQYLLPVIKKSLLKVYEDNFLLSDTVEDDFVLKILKDNLQVAIGFIQIIKTVLDFLLQNSEINLYNLSNTPISLVQLISSTFEHCKNSTHVYKDAFNAELLELFKATQEVHLLFLKLFEIYIVINNEPENAEEIQILSEVLDTICGMSETLSALNIKSMSDNWKGYTAIAQKFSSSLLYTINLKSPILILGYGVSKNLSSIENQGEIDLKLISPVVKITSFLIKVTMKICDIFWNCLEQASNEILKFCCIVYSFPTDLYRSQGHLPENLTLIECAIFKTVEPLLQRLLKDPLCLKVFSEENMTSEKKSFGLLNFLNKTLRILVLNGADIISQLNIRGIINAIFTSVNLCFVEFFWDEYTENIFESLILNISAIVIFHNEYYEEVEIILLRNLLQEHIFSALLALEVWTLLLSNATPPFRLMTLTSLVQKCGELDFGTFTNRVELIYMKCFLQRIFKMLPNYTKNDFVLKNNPVRSMDCWRMIQFKDFPPQQRLSIEGICRATIEKMEAMKNGNVTFKDVIFVADNLEVLSTANFIEIGLDPTNLATSVHDHWQFNLSNIEITSNNVFKYFMMPLCKITGALVMELSNKQLIEITSQLKIISSNDSYKLIACDVLSSLSKKRFENGQDNFKINTLIAEILCQNLLTASTNVIKQRALEVIHNFSINDKHDAVKNILRLSKEMQGEISNYLQRNVVTSNTKFDKDYFASLGNISFQHECLKWRNEAVLPKSKKLKITPVEEVGYDENKKLQPLAERQAAKPTKWCKAFESRPVSVDSCDDTVDGVIKNIKGEVKCLVNVLKTEKLTAKNASDIRLLANQLLSLL